MAFASAVFSNAILMIPISADWSGFRREKKGRQ